MYRCPKCKSTHLSLQVKMWRQLVETHSEISTREIRDAYDTGDWDYDSQCMCDECSHEDALRTFQYDEVTLDSLRTELQTLRSQSGSLNRTVTFMLTLMDSSQLQALSNYANGARDALKEICWSDSDGYRQLSAFIEHLAQYLKEQEYDDTHI